MEYAIKVIESIYGDPRILISRRVEFKNILQEEDESISNFAERLQSTAAFCEFNVLEQDLVRNLTNTDITEP